ncbi:MAG: hypothetical protein SF182_01525 [Deltaproteobacteria bacterium]|nr:hypothetical protein [Deltaproteobacteria bacterium]
MAARRARYDRHDEAVTFVTAALRARRCRVRIHLGDDKRRRGVTLDVWPPGATAPLAIAVRAATPRPQHHRIRQGARRYEYEIVELHWNLHAHGARHCQPDVWVLVRLDDKPASLVLPNRALAPTLRAVQLIANPRRGGWSRLRGYAGRWELITQPAAQAAA